MRIGLALGSNLGDRTENLRIGRDFIISLNQGTAPALLSPIYQTEPVGCPPGTAPFLNAVMEIESPLHPAELLAKFSVLETRQGRPALREKNTPRPLDIDILYVGDLVLLSETIAIPHPRIANRRFVLQPLADILPNLRLPGYDKTVAQLLAALPSQPAVKLFLRDW